MLSARSLRALAASPAPSAAPLTVRAKATAAAQPIARVQDEALLEEERRRAPRQHLIAAALAASAHNQELLEQLQEREIRIPVPWGHIAGKWWGRTDRRPLVALHGLGDNAASFERLAGSLRGGVPLLALDLPGHGLSSRLPRGLLDVAPDAGLLLAALRRVQRALRLTALSLVGHAQGDALALLYAATYPADVDMYVSLDTLVPVPQSCDAVVKSQGSRVDELLDAEESDSPDLDKSPQAVDDWSQRRHSLIVSRGGSVSRLAAETLLKRGAGAGGDSRAWRTASMSAPLALACARAVRCPTLAVLPEWRAPRPLAADPELRARFLADLRLAAKSVTAVSVAGTHHVHLNSPEVVMPALRDFLDRHRGRHHGELAVPVDKLAV